MPCESRGLGSKLAPLSFLLDNPLQTAVLNLFVSLKSRFPNLVVGSITRDSVKRALMNGITADQVGCFRHSHYGGDGLLTMVFLPNLDHQLLDHTRASPNEEERESSARLPHAVHLTADCPSHDRTSFRNH